MVNVNNSPLLRLLVPIINSPLDSVALDYATALGAGPPISIYLMEVVADIGLLQAADARLSSFADRLASEHIEASRLVRVGVFGPTIAAAAGVVGADTIVCASDRASSLDARLNGDIVADLAEETTTPLIVVPPAGATVPPRVLVHDSGDIVATVDPFVSELVEATAGEVLLSDSAFGTPQAVLAAARGRGANLVALNREQTDMHNSLLAGGLSVLILK